MRSPKHIQLTRTFSVHEEPHVRETHDHVYSMRLPRGPITWEDVRECRIGVILGERGLGKSAEFRNQAALLRAAERHAFFIPLPEIHNAEQLGLLIESLGPAWPAWLASNDPGYMFLDSVDGSRLGGADAFRQALALFMRAIRAHLHRVSIFISSRPTDWASESVREIVARFVAQPMWQADLTFSRPEMDDSQPVHASKEESALALSVHTYRLDPLSTDQAQELATGRGVSDVREFWKAVEERGYQFMANSPLDLHWMAESWILNRALDGYEPFIKSWISNRLAESNELYLESGAARLPDELREMAEELAAMCTFSGRHFIAFGTAQLPPSAVTHTVLLPASLEKMYRPLLHSAIFRDDTLGRSEFEHASIREYLAARWAKRRLDSGCPLTLALELFTAQPFEHRVAISKREAVFAWLATLHAGIRRAVIDSFPALVFREGDPDRWGPAAVVEALENCLRAGTLPPLGSSIGNVSWSQPARVARAVPAADFVRLLGENTAADQAVVLMSLASLARCMEVAPTLLSIYESHDRPIESRRDALITLKSLGGPDQSRKITDDILDDRIEDEPLLAAAIALVDLSRMTVQRLRSLFERTEHVEEIRGGGNSGWTTPELGRPAELDSCLLLIQAVLEYEANRPQEDAEPSKARPDTWISRSLEDCLSQALALMPPNTGDIPDVLLQAARAMGLAHHRNSWRSSLNELYRQIKEVPVLHAKFLEGVHEHWPPSESEPLAAKNSEATLAKWNAAAEVARLDLKRRGMAQLHELRSASPAGIELLREIVSQYWLRDQLLTEPEVCVNFVARHLDRQLGIAFREGLLQAWRCIDIEKPKRPEPGKTIRLDDTSLSIRLLGLASISFAVREGLELRSLSAGEARRALQLTLWSHRIHANWIGELARARPQLVMEALWPWFEEELHGDSPHMTFNEVISGIRGSDDAILTPLVTRALNLIEQERLDASRLGIALVLKLLDGPAPPRGDLARTARKLVEIMGDSSDRRRFDWYSIWADADFAGALDFFREQLQRSPDSPSIESFAGKLKKLRWSKLLTGSSREIQGLSWLYQYFHETPSRPLDSSDATSGLHNPSSPVAFGILMALASLRGAEAHQALLDIAIRCGDVRASRLLRDHSVEEANARESMTPESVREWGQLFMREARSEAELFLQLLARLNDIRESIEAGPFSERGLFRPGLAEPEIQLWLAARLSEAPGRPFISHPRVHREPQGDLGHRADIEVSSGVGTVCIEIKPIDARRPYSASYLVDTALEEQLVGKYLRGRNSSHGILFLMRLENRTWNIPDGPERGTFRELLEYLQKQADAIRGRTPGVAGLRVVGIDCVSPKTKSPDTPPATRRFFARPGSEAFDAREREP